MNTKVTKEKVSENLETVTPDKFEFLSNFVDATINKDDAGAEQAFSQYLLLKAKERYGVVQEKAEPVAQDTEEDEDDDDDEEGGSKYAHLLKQRTKRKQPLKKMKKGDVNESVLREFMGDTSPVKLKGDDVFVEGKQVGTIENDMTNLESGITFTSADGKVTKEFEDLQGLYEFLVTHFKVNPEV